MIELITGLPGNCKTLYTIAYVRDWAKRDSRAVFYAGVPLTDKGKEELGWQEIQAEKWMEAPPNSIVIVDECQKIFRNRSLGQIPGKHVTDLETHRHLGIDLVFITQHPSLVDPAIRKLTGRHKHMVRIWGGEKSTVHKWDAVRDNCDKGPQRKDSERTVFKFDKSIYPLYKSAEVHTVKRQIPMRVILLWLSPLVLLAAAYAVYSLTLKKKLDPAPAAMVSGAPAAGGSPVSAGGVPAAPKFDPVADAKEYAWKQTPRVVGLLETAPKYDQLTQPQAVPVAAACVYAPARKVCSCYTQQATPLNMPFNQCLSIAQNGSFQEFNPNGQQEQARTSQSVQVLDSQTSLPISGSSTKNTLPVNSASSLPNTSAVRLSPVS